MTDKMTPEAQRNLERKWELQREAVDLLALIAMEFKSDPQSVKCFDLRTVRRAIEVSDALRELMLL